MSWTWADHDSNDIARSSSLFCYSLSLQSLRTCPPCNIVIVCSSFQMSMCLDYNHSQSFSSFDELSTLFPSSTITCASSISWRCICASHKSLCLFFITCSCGLPKVSFNYVTPSPSSVVALPTITSTSSVATMNNWFSKLWLPMCCKNIPNLEYLLLVQ